MHDEYTVIKLGDRTTCLNVKFLPTILKYDRPNDGFVVTSRNL